MWRGWRACRVPTVSRVFTPGADVAAETRERVAAAAAALDYRPNVIARSLTMQRTRLVGVVVGDIDNPFYATLLRHIATELQARGLAALVFVASYDEFDASSQPCCPTRSTG